jgi:hypothetical protein
MPWLPFQPKMKNNVVKAYMDNRARKAKRRPDGRIHDVTNLEEGSNSPV